MIPFQICFRDMPPSDAIWIDVQQRIEKLETFFDHVISCDVVISAPYHHHQKGKVPHIQIRLRVPGTCLIVRKESEKDKFHKDIYVAISAGFHALKRQLEDFVHKQRQFVKEHHASPHGFVTCIFSDQEYGFIETLDEHELFFHKNAVLHSEFDKLLKGTEVKFSEELGENGPQVTSMSIIGKMSNYINKENFAIKP